MLAAIYLLGASPLARPARIATDSPSLRHSTKLAATSRAFVPGSRERIELMTEDEIVIVADFYVPRSSKQLAPGAILVHDAGCERGSLESFAERLQKQGFGVLSLDLRGHGESATTGLDWSSLEGEGRKRLWAFGSRDLRAASEFLRGQSNIHSTSISLLAHGRGGALAAHHAGRDENVRALAILSPPAEDSFGFNFFKDLAYLETLPTLFAVSTDARDEAETLASECEEAAGYGSFIEIKSFQTADHEILSNRRAPAEVAKWLKDQAMPKRGSGGR